MRTTAMATMAALLLVVILPACREGGGSTPSSRIVVTTDATLDAGPLQDSLNDGGFYRVRGQVSRDCLVSFSDWFENDTGEPIAVTGAEFRSVDGVTVAGIMKLPEGVTGVGNLPGFPPRELEADWQQAQELVGSTLKPGEYVTLVIGLRLENEKEGVATEFTLEYEIDDGQRYRATDNDSFTAVPNPRSSCLP